MCLKVLSEAKEERQAFCAFSFPVFGGTALILPMPEYWGLLPNVSKNIGLNLMTLRKYFWKSATFFILICGFSLLIDIYFSYPYEFFPGDDIYDIYYGKTIGNRNDYIGSSVFMFFCKMQSPKDLYYSELYYLYRLFPRLSSTNLLYLSVILNTLLLSIFVIILSWVIFKDHSISFVSLIFVLFSVYRGKYLYFSSYAVFSSLITIITLICITLSLDDTKNPLTSASLCAIGGIISPLMIVSFSSAPIALLGIIFPFIYVSVYSKKHGGLFIYGFFFISTLSLITFFDIRTLFQVLNVNLMMNIYSNNLGKIPSYIPLYFFIVLFFHQPFLLLLLFVVIFLSLTKFFCINKKQPIATKLSLHNRKSDNYAIRFLVLFLITALVLHELSPTTKLARLYYYLHPIMVIIVIGLLLTMIRNLRFSKILISAMILITMIEYILGMRNMSIARMSLVREMLGSKPLKVYMLNSDPYYPYFAKYSIFNSKSKDITLSSISDLSKLLESFKQDYNDNSSLDYNHWLIIGPEGKNSIFRHSSFPEHFEQPDILNDENFEVRLIPFYSMHPLFYLEEELSTYLFLKKRDNFLSHFLLNPNQVFSYIKLIKPKINF